MNDYEQIKERLDILKVITGETGLKMARKHLEECPFCAGHECFSIDQGKGVYKCFQCPEEGDVFIFLERYHSTDKHEALKLAAKLAGVNLPERRPRELRLTTKERIFLEAAEYYHDHVFTNGGRTYLVDRRGHQEDVIRKMKLGYTDGALVDHLKGKGFSEGDIRLSGLAKERTDNGVPHLVDFFVKDLAIFPHMDEGRVLHFTIKDPSKRYKYQLSNEARLKDWKFYNQGALSKFNEIIAVEGENDLLSVMDAGVFHVIGLIGQPADYQLKALKTKCKGKHLYLWVDNDIGGHGGWDDKGKWHDGFVRQICKALLPDVNIRIITHPGGAQEGTDSRKDPDDYLQHFEGDKRKEVKRLQEEAADYITWEIGEIRKLETLEDRLKALKDREIFRAVANMVEAEKLVYIEKIEGLGFNERAIEEQLEMNRELLMELGLYLHGLEKKNDADPNRIAEIIFKHLNKDGRFFRDREGKVYLLYQHYIYDIGNNRPFCALMKRATRLLPTKEPGRSVWESLASEAYNSGKRIDLMSWLYTDRNTDSIYVNLNSANNVILKINKGATEEIPNGLNEEGVLLRSSRKILPMNYLPDVDVREGMRYLKDLVFANFTCEREQRYLILSWFIAAFLLDFAPYMALMKFSGATSSGKTTAAKLLSLLIYGHEHLGDPSTAAAYAVSSQNPLLIIDNLESDDITKSGLKFLLLSATKGGKEKRTQGTESDTTEEQPKALVLITAIEPFTKPELINRTYDIEFANKFKADDFVEDEVIREIIKKRDIILSAIIKFLQKEILPHFAKRKEYITILKKEYRGHSKSRTDEFLALLMLILERMVRHIPYYDEEDPYYGAEEEFGWGDGVIRKAWIEYQDAKAKDTETSSNNIIKMLDGVVREYLMKAEGDKSRDERDYLTVPETYPVRLFHPEYGLELEKHRPERFTDEKTGEDYHRTYIEFVASPGDIVAAFDRFCKNNGLRNPYANTGIFGERLKNDKGNMVNGGWEVISKEGIEPYFKVVRGVRFWKFRKTFIR